MSELNEVRNNRVLIIDDNASIHDDFKKILCPDGAVDVAEDEAILFESVATKVTVNYELESAHQGQEGWEEVKAARLIGRPYAVAFVDMRMPPGWDGLETITRLWEADSELEVVICSAFSDYSWTEIATRLGSSHQLLILKKPFDNAEVAQIAMSLTEKWNLARRSELRMDTMEELIVDRTEKAEKARSETEALLTAISSVVIGINEVGIVHRWNRSAEELFNTSHTDAVGRPFRELTIEWVDPEQAESFFDPFNLVGATRSELKLVRNDSTRVLGASRYPVTDNGVNRGFLCLGTDITEKFQLEQQLHQAQKLESVGQLAAGVAHEINTPMQYVGDNLAFLRNKMTKLEPLLESLVANFQVSQTNTRADEAVAEIQTHLKKLKVKSFLQLVLEAIDDSREGVHHVSRIVRAMKEFAHPGQEEKAPVDINRALESTIAVSTNEWKYVAEIETHLDPDLPMVLALTGEINQVFLNILVNAAHAIGDTNESGATGKGRIDIFSRHVDDHIEVTISDSGAGIPENIRERIFDPFFTTKEVGKGTGQGLAIAHSVVVGKHGGELRCESRSEGGTTFVIQLPIDAAQFESSEESEKTVTVEEVAALMPHE